MNINKLLKGETFDPQKREDTIKACRAELLAQSGRAQHDNEGEYELSEFHRDVTENAGKRRFGRFGGIAAVCGSVAAFAVIAVGIGALVNNGVIAGEGSATATEEAVPDVTAGTTVTEAPEITNEKPVLSAEEARAMMTEYFDTCYNPEAKQINIEAAKEYLCGRWDWYDGSGELYTSLVGMYGQSMFPGITGVYETDSYVFVSGVAQDEQGNYMGAVKKSDPDKLAYITNLQYSGDSKSDAESFFAERGENFTNGYTYSRSGDNPEDKSKYLNDLSIAFYAQKYGFDSSLIRPIEYTDADGTMWENTAAYNCAARTVTYLVEEGEDYLTLKAELVRGDQAYDYSTDEVNYRDMTFTITKDESGEFARRIDSVSDIRTVVKETVTVRGGFDWYNFYKNTYGVDKASLGFDLSLAKKYFYGVWTSEDGADTFSVGQYGKSFNNVSAVFETEKYAYLIDLTGGTATVLAVEKNAPEMLYYGSDLSMIDPDENYSEAVSVPYTVYNRTGDDTTGTSEPLNSFSRKELCEKYGFTPSELYYGIYTDESLDPVCTHWHNGYDEVIVAAHDLYLIDEGSDYVSIRTRLIRADQLTVWDAQVDYIVVEYTVKKSADGWVKTIDKINGVYNVIPSDEQNKLGDFNWRDYFENYVYPDDYRIDPNIAKYFYGQWLNTDMIFELGEYGDCSFYNVHSVYETSRAYYLTGMGGGVGYAAAILKDDPNTMYYASDISYSPGEMGIDFGIIEDISYIVLTKTGDYTLDKTQKLNSFSVAALREKYGIPADQSFYPSDYTDENGVVWCNEGGYVIAPDYPKYVAEESADSITINTTMARRDEIIDFDTMVHFRDVQYTLTRSGGEWVYKLQAVSSVYMVDADGNKTSGAEQLNTPVNKSLTADKVDTAALDKLLKKLVGKPLSDLETAYTDELAEQFCLGCDYIASKTVPAGSVISFLRTEDFNYINVTAFISLGDVSAIGKTVAEAEKQFVNAEITTLELYSEQTVGTIIDERFSGSSFGESAADITSVTLYVSKGKYPFPSTASGLDTVEALEKDATYSGAYVTTRSHSSVSVFAPLSSGTKITALLDGVVLDVGMRDAYGFSVLVQSSDGFLLRYSQLAYQEVIKLKVGDNVKKGQDIGMSGITGLTSEYGVLITGYDYTGSYGGAGSAVIE